MRKPDSEDLEQGLIWKDQTSSSGISAWFSGLRNQINYWIISTGFSFMSGIQGSQEYSSEMYGSNKISSHQNSDRSDYFIHESFEQHGKILKYVIQYQQNRNLTYADVIQKFRQDATFRSVFTDIFRDCKFKAYFWETVPVSLKYLEKQTFEFVIIESKQLAQMRSDKQSFQEHFSKAKNQPAVSFYNLGKDAMLVAPTPSKDVNADYTHLASFIKTSPEEQANMLWKNVGESVNKCLLKNPHDPLWVSTCGTGVGWLHVRLDSRPKYYSYESFKSFNPPTKKPCGCCTIL